MLTEDEARALLERAAATIDVQPGLPIVGTRRTPRRWVVPVIASAAVTAAVVSGVVLIDRDHGSTPQPGSIAPTPQMPKDRIPSVFSYDKTSALALLRQRGLRVIVTDMEPSCSTAGRADHTEPRAGTRFRPGQTVQLFVTASTQGLCAGAGDGPAWALVDFANGRGPAPRFAPTVQVYLNGEHSELTGAEAADRQTWVEGTAIGALATLISKTDLPNFEFGMPTLHVTTGRPEGCTFGRRNEIPQSLRSREAYQIRFVVPSIGPDPCFAVDEFRDSKDRIDTILVRVPNYAVYPPAPELTPSPDPDGVGARFLAFAQDQSDSIPVDTPVKLYLGGVLRKTIDADMAGDRSAYDLCPAYAERSCPVSAVSTIADYPHDPVIVSTVGTCVENPEPLKPSDVGAADVVILGVAEPATCLDDFAVQVFSNDVGQIVAVNLLLGSP